MVSCSTTKNRPVELPTFTDAKVGVIAYGKFIRLIVGNGWVL